MRRLAIICLMLSSSAFADFTLPKLRIIGKREVDPGNMVVLKAEFEGNIDGDVQYDWKVLVNNKEQEDIIIWPDGTQVFFGAGLQNKSFTIISTATIVNKEKKKYIVKTGETDNNGPLFEELELIHNVNVGSQTLITVVNVGTPQPTPPPTPVPPTPTPPAPVFPDGKYKLAGRAYEWALKSGINNREDIKKGGNAIALSFDESILGTKSQISAGVKITLSDLLSNIKKTQADKLKSLGVNVDDWKFYSSQQGEALYELYEQGKIKTVTDMLDAFSEISIGLKKL